MKNKKIRETAESYVSSIGVSKVHEDMYFGIAVSAYIAGYKFGLRKSKEK